MLVTKPQTDFNAQHNYRPAMEDNKVNDKTPCKVVQQFSGTHDINHAHDYLIYKHYYGCSMPSSMCMNHWDYATSYESKYCL